MTPAELITARETYGYVPACMVIAPDSAGDLIWQDLRLVRQLPSHDEWNTPGGRSKYSSINLDAHHTKLLNGNDDKDILHGLLSAVFWGYASGTDGLFHVVRAIAKAKAVISGRSNSAPQPRAEVLQRLRAARALLQDGNVQDALLLAMEIKFLDMSFASKVLMFINPSKAAVYDARIGASLAGDPDISLQSMAVSSRSSTRKAEAYSRWCAYCVEKAADMNQTGYRWKDWNSAKYAWRAVDIERAFFAQARQ
jgi:hypothetical protein